MTYLALYSQESYSSAPIRYPGQRYYPGNEHMHSGLRFVNGYSPMLPAGTTRLFGFNYIGALSTRDPPSARRLGPILKRMAVDGLVTWPGSGVRREIPWDEFEPRAEVFGATVHRRKSGITPRVQRVRKARLTSAPDKVWRQEVSPLPVVETPGRPVPEPRTVDFGDAELHLVAETRLGVTVDVDARASPLPVLVCFARPWLPGYRVELDGRRAELMRLDAIQPAVEVPAGRRTRVALTYRPAALRLGLALFAVTAAGLLAAFALPAVRRNRR